jgi:ATP-dependent DNA ligase
VGAQATLAGLSFPVQPMLAVTADAVPEGAPGTWAYEPKFDGFRCIAVSTAGRVILQSRQEKSLTRCFPEIVDAVGKLRTDIVLDGELVLWRHGRLDFEALQRRLTPRRGKRSQQTSYVVFDVLACGDIDLRSHPYRSRRAILELLLRGAARPPGLVLTPMSTEPCVAQAWLVNHSEAGIEGVVAKRTTQPYRCGRSGWRKIRTRSTAEAVVGGVIGSIARPDALILGRIDEDGRLRVVGCTGRLPKAAAREVAALLVPSIHGHPWPETIPTSRFGRLPSESVAYTRVAPTVVVELEVDTAFEQERWRHAPRYVRIRGDLALDGL